MDHDNRGDVPYDDEYDDEENDGNIGYVASSLAFNPKSRAEETMEREHREKIKRGLLPEGFQQEFHIDGTLKYPYHPDGSRRYSNFAIGFNGCFNCGEQHRFNDCTTRATPEGKNRFHFNLHCHKPEVYFKYIASRKYVPHNQSGGHLSLGRGRGATTPAWLQSSTSRYGPSPGQAKRNQESYDVVPGSSKKSFVSRIRSYLINKGGGYDVCPSPQKITCPILLFLLRPRMMQLLFWHYMIREEL